MTAKWWKRLGRGLLAAVLLLAVVYAVDWTVLRIRILRGTAYGSVEVDQFLATSLKGNKTEYDLMGTAEVTCTRSIFPQKGNPACWWVERHKSHWE